LDNGRVKCWGGNFEGSLGLGNNQPHGTQPSEMGDGLPYVDLGTGRTAKAIAAGHEHTCVLLDNDKVKCWGEGTRGALGLGTNKSRGDDPNEMGDTLPYVDLGTGRTAKSIAAGGSATCAILDNDVLKCWGAGSDGELGVPTGTGNLGDSPNEMGDNLLPV